MLCMGVRFLGEVISKSKLHVHFDVFYIPSIFQICYSHTFGVVPIYSVHRPYSETLLC